MPLLSPMVQGRGWGKRGGIWGSKTLRKFPGAHRWEKAKWSLNPGLQPTPVFLPGEFYGQRRLAGYSSWGHKESDTTERLTLSLTSSVLGNLGWSQASFYTVVSQISEDTTSSLSRCTFPLLASPFLPVTPISPSLLFSLNSVSNLSEINCHVLLRL